MHPLLLSGEEGGEGSPPGDGTGGGDFQQVREFGSEEGYPPVLLEGFQGFQKAWPILLKPVGIGPVDREGDEYCEPFRPGGVFAQVGSIDGKEPVASPSGAEVGHEAEEGVDRGEAAFFDSCAQDGCGLFMLLPGQEQKGVKKSGKGVEGDLPGPLFLSEALQPLLVQLKGPAFLLSIKPGENAPEGIKTGFRIF